MLPQERLESIRANTDKLERHTVRPCPRTGPDAPREIILVPPATDLGPGFEMARARLAARQAVRLAAMGVTFERAWPDWVRTTPGLWLTDLGAYRRTSRWEATASLRTSLAALCDEVFAGVAPGLSGADVFYPHIGFRAFATVAFAMPVALGFAERHARDTVHCTRPDWPGYEIFRAVVEAGRDRGELRRPRRARWAVRVSALTAAGWAVSMGRILRMYAGSRFGLREMARRASGKGARLWIQLFPDVRRINPALIEATGEERVGVLLHGNLGRGERPEAELSSRRGHELWPGLKTLDPARALDWETTSVPEDVAAFARSCMAFTGACFTATARLCRHGPGLDVGPYRLDMTGRARDLAKLLTLDVARVCLADSATRTAVRRHDVRGATIISVGAMPADVALSMRRLAGAGATTIDFAYGWSAEPEPFTDDLSCSYRCVWVYPNVVPGDARFLVGGMPTPPRWPKPARAPGDSRTRVLVLSNYLHRDDRVYQMGLDSYQEELLDVIRLRSDRYAFCWRPHPADREVAVKRAAVGLPADVSRGRPFSQDLAWADVVISALSTTVAEALLLDLPVLVHITPDVEGGELLSPFSPERTFVSAAEGVEKLDALVASLARPNALAPEQRARAALFGGTLKPPALLQAIASISPT